MILMDIENVASMLVATTPVYKTTKVDHVSGTRSSPDDTIGRNPAQWTASSATQRVAEVTSWASMVELLEDQEDIEAALAAEAEDPNPMPYDEFRKELGL